MTQFIFLTFTVKHWYYIFDSHLRFEILFDPLKYCQKNKDLKLYAWVFMINHIHLIGQNEDMSGFVRDFKKYVSKEIIANLNRTEPTVAKLFIEEDGKYSI
jgi:putative transposase